MVSKSYQNMETYINYANNESFNKLNADWAWLVLDKSGKKLRFLCISKKYMPNASRFVPLLAYRIDRKEFLSETGVQKQNPIWESVNWAKVEERLAEALQEPESSDQKLKTAPIFDW